MADEVQGTTVPPKAYEPAQRAKDEDDAARAKDEDAPKAQGGRRGTAPTPDPVEQKRKSMKKMDKEHPRRGPRVLPPEERDEETTADWVNRQHTLAPDHVEHEGNVFKSSGPAVQSTQETRGVTNPSANPQELTVEDE